MLTTIDDHPLSSTFPRIPDELQLKILGYLTVQDLLKITGVGYVMYDISLVPPHPSFLFLRYAANGMIWLMKAAYGEPSISLHSTKQFPLTNYSR